jgi:hypothetical protein
MRARTAVLSATVVAFVVAVVTPVASGRTSSATDTKAWCDAVIRTNTKYGTMKNKRFLPSSQVPLSAWKKLADEAVAHGDRFIALAPSEIKTAVRHEIAWFKRLKANNYSRTTPLAPWTVAEVAQITKFEKTKCGITFSG